MPAVIAGGIALALLLVGLGVAAAVRSRNSNTSPSDLRVGQCFNVKKAIGSTSVGGAVTPQRVGCDQPHQREVIGVVAYPGGTKVSYPGSDTVRSFASTSCRPRAEAFVGANPPRAVTLYLLYPATSDQWKRYDATVICSVGLPADEKVTGSLKAT